MVNEYDALSSETNMPVDITYLHLWKLDVFL